MKKKLFVLGMFFVICFSMFGCGGENKNNEPATDTNWGEGGLWDILPQPDTENWEVSVETDTYISIDVEGSEEEFNDYVNKCREDGFEVDLYSSDGYYCASNEEGYFVDCYFYDDDKKYSISIDDRRNQDKEENATETDEKISEADPSTSDSSSGEVTPEFKEAMDSYEQFFQEYVDFMETYNNSDDPTSLMGEYNDYMKQYTDTMAKLDDIDEDSLSEADKQYYVEVSTRISSMLTDSLGDML